MTVVIGRLHPLRVGSPGWDRVRAAQVAVAQGDPLAAWVDTDAIERGAGMQALHFTDTGYRDLARRFAEAAASTLAAGRPVRDGER